MTDKAQMELIAAQKTILWIAEVAAAVGWQAGVGASETAGMIVSCLAARPELIERFMTEGSSLLVEGEILPDKGKLTFHRIDGKVTTPQELRSAMTVRDICRTSLTKDGDRS